MNRMRISQPLTVSSSRRIVMKNGNIPYQKEKPVRNLHDPDPTVHIHNKN